MEIRELLEKRATLVNNARELVDKADEEKRDLTAEEQEIYDRHFADINGLDERIKKEDELREAERKLETYKPDDKVVGEPEDKKAVTATED